jgi:hypothetical protein
VCVTVIVLSFIMFKGYICISDKQFHLFLPIQFTRDALIVISGAKEAGRDFVYFTDVKRIPNTDLATIERLWTKFSGGKFGYSVQKVRLREPISERNVCIPCVIAMLSSFEISWCYRKR